MSLTAILAVLLFGAGAVFVWLKFSEKKEAGDELATATPSLDAQLDSKFRTEWSDADLYVSRARRLWPSLKVNPFFWSGIGTSTLICILGIIGASALGQGEPVLTYLWMAIFVIANVVQAWIAVLGDTGRGEWYEFVSGDRPAWHWPVLALLLGVNFLASITGSSNVAEKLAVTSQINVSTFEGTKRELKQAEADLDRLRTRRIQEAPGYSAEALQETAREMEEKAEREADRGGCGPKCEAIKKDAIKWRALANDAVTERKLGEKIAVLRDNMSTMSDEGTARTVESPHAELIENATGGSISKGQVEAYLAPMFWLMISVVDVALWLWAGDYAGRYRMEQYKIRAEAANTWLTNANLPARYKITDDGIVEDVKAITGPGGGPGDTINIDLSETAEARIQKSPRLQQIRYLFDSVLLKADGVKIPIGRAYEVFAKIRSEQGERHYMNPQDFRSAITDYCEIMGIELISNQIIGYKVGLTQTQIKEAAE